MFAWRICKRRHLRTAFSGIGAEKVGGRWNFPGHRVVYCSASLSLASLELFVHLEPMMVPTDLRSVSAEIPDRVSRQVLTSRDLPRDWRTYPAPDELKRIGSEWVAECRSLILIVPSAVNPEESNILINPVHREFARIRISRSKPFQFDPRMWKK